MTDFQAWTPPPGAVVEPPVHRATIVDAFHSDGDWLTNVSAGSINWSSEGDGPRVVAYAVVQEYKPELELREWWISSECAWATQEEARKYSDDTPIHVREVQPAAREVVAWAVVKGDGVALFEQGGDALNWGVNYGGKVVKLVGFLPSSAPRLLIASAWP